MSRKDKGFTLIELLVVVAIIGILSAMAMTQFRAAITRARQKRTMADMRTIAQSWEQRALEMNSYGVAGAVAGVDAGYTFPGTAVSFDQLAAALVPDYSKNVLRYDGWGKEYEFAVSTVGDTYAIRSAGRDGVFDDSITVGSTNDPDCDIVYSEGRFVSYPETLQSN